REEEGQVTHQGPTEPEAYTNEGAAAFAYASGSDGLHPVDVLPAQAPNVSRQSSGVNSLNKGRPSTYRVAFSTNNSAMRPGKARLRSAPATCGVTITLGKLHSGCSGGSGYAKCVSIAAPAIHPSRSARNSACS